MYGPYSATFESNYGKVSGKAAPHEGGQFWGRFFDVHDYTSRDALDNDSVESMRSSVALAEWLYGGVPFVNKNVKHMLRLDALSHVFPDAHFLVVRRDQKDVALSLLRGRYENRDDPSEWWSVRPPTYDHLKELPVVDQIVGQVRDLERKQEEDLNRLPSEQVHFAVYDQFCQDPEGTIDKLKKSPFDSLPPRNSCIDSFQASVNAPSNYIEKRVIEKLAG
jgi:hypothetical protein